MTNKCTWSGRIANEENFNAKSFGLGMQKLVKAIGHLTLKDRTTETWDTIPSGIATNVRSQSTFVCFSIQ